MATTVEQALAQIDHWPGKAAAAAVGTDGIIATHGPIDEPFALASVTKVLVAMACWVAHEEGTLPFDDPVEVEVETGAVTCTVADLLAHCAGLAPEGRVRMALPGTKRIYSNAGFEVLGEHLTGRSGLPVATYLHEAVLHPLGATSTSLTGSPAHGAISTVRDLSSVARELLTPTLVDPSTHARATGVHHPGLSGVLPGYGRQDDNAWGLGVEVRATKHPHWTSPDNSPATFGHFGRSGTMAWVDPVRRLALIALCDEPFGAWAVEAWPALSSQLMMSVT